MSRRPGSSRQTRRSAAAPAPAPAASGSYAKSSSAAPPEVEIVEDRRSGPGGQVAVRQYRKGKLLGKGGFARCYSFMHLSRNRLVAGKVVAKTSLEKPRARQKLLAEIRIHRSLAHPRVVHFESYFEDNKNVYIILELCHNHTMMEMMARRKRLTVPETQCMMLQLIDGVRYLHANNIIHRDLKLGNLFINREMEIKIGDFGLAAQLEDKHERKKTICGTPNYIAPEILDGRSGHSFQVDTWSLGVILYTMLVGKPPFQTDRVKATYKRIRDNEYTFPDHVPVSDVAKSLIRSILVPKPARRPSLDSILRHEFFTGADACFPRKLPVTALREPPYLSPDLCHTGSDLIREVLTADIPAIRVKRSSNASRRPTTASSSSSSSSSSSHTAAAGAGGSAATSATTTSSSTRVSGSSKTTAPMPLTSSSTANTHRPSSAKSGRKPATTATATATSSTATASTATAAPLDSTKAATAARSSRRSARRSTATAENDRYVAMPAPTRTTRSTRARPSSSRGSSPSTSKPVLSAAASASVPISAPTTSSSPTTNTRHTRTSGTGTRARRSSRRSSDAAPIAPAPEPDSSERRPFSTMDTNQRNDTTATKRDVPTNPTYAAFERPRRVSSRRAALPLHNPVPEVSPAPSLAADSRSSSHHQTRVTSVSPSPSVEREESGTLLPVSSRQQAWVTGEPAATSAGGATGSSPDSYEPFQAARAPTLATAPSLYSNSATSAASSDSLTPPAVQPVAVVAPVPAPTLAVRKGSTASAPSLRNPLSTKSKKIAPPASASASTATSTSSRSTRATAVGMDTLKAVHDRLLSTFSSSSKKRPVIGKSEPSDHPATWVTTWVDYTSKYGLGYMLNNGCVGVYFNDSTKIVLSSGGSKFEYIDRTPAANGGRRVTPEPQCHTLTCYPDDLQKKVTLLKHFRGYLKDQYDTLPHKCPEEMATIARGSADAELPYVKKWVRTRHAVLFRLSNSTVQINFFDHTALTLCSDASHLTFVSKDGSRTHHELGSIVNASRPDITKRLKYTKDILSQLINGAR